MILLVHMLFGAGLAAVIKNPFGAIVLAFVSHYFLDFFPHIEYPIKNIESKKFRKSLPDFLKVFLDFFIGITLIFFFSNNQAITYFCAFFAIAPDGLTFLKRFLKNNFLKKHSQFHQQKLHFLRDKKISIFWRVLNQIIVVMVSIILIGS